MKSNQKALYTVQSLFLRMFWFFVLARVSFIQFWMEVCIRFRILGDLRLNNIHRYSLQNRLILGQERIQILPNLTLWMRKFWRIQWIFQKRLEAGFNQDYSLVRMFLGKWTSHRWKLLLSLIVLYGGFHSWLIIRLILAFSHQKFGLH